ncbi:Chitin synthase, class 3 [Nowakowskiella sp. JEL0407]|nr:Chitin synthase, class 3 [Nowakowskiella sp. JEL0407]
MESAPNDSAALHRANTLNTIHSLPRVFVGNSALPRKRTIPKKHKKQDDSRITVWKVVVNIITCCFPPFVFSICCRKKDPYIRHAFREKIALCLIILFVSLAVGYITFGFRLLACNPITRIDYRQFVSTESSAGTVSLHGYVHNIQTFNHQGAAASFDAKLGSGKDLSFLFPKDNAVHACNRNFPGKFVPLPCTIIDTSKKINFTTPYRACHNSSLLNTAHFRNFAPYSNQQLYVSWADLKNSSRLNYKFIAYNGKAWEISRLTELESTYFAYIDKSFLEYVKKSVGKDITLGSRKKGWKKDAECLDEVFAVANMDSEDPGCVGTMIIFYVSVVIIVGVTAIRFVFAVLFALLIGWRLGVRKPTTRNAQELKRRKEEIKQQSLSRGKNKQRLDEQTVPLEHSVSVDETNTNSDRTKVDGESSNGHIPSIEDISDPTRMHILAAVPCYSENSLSIRTTLDSIADSYYPATHKCIIVIADGVVQGRGNPKPTSDLVLDMMDFGDDATFSETKAYPYISIGEGVKRRNMARVYAGWYRFAKSDLSLHRPKKKDKEKKVISDDSDLEKSYHTGTMRSIKSRKEGRVPMVLIVKTGLESEQLKPKPGNRGKRDSQVLLMSFLSKIVFDDRISELEFEIFHKIYSISGVHPSDYDAVLFVDADTMIYKDSITHMVSCFLNDPRVMGLCGETRIQNKWTSWVTMIQVFEYFVSHHLSKAFESMFGSVICLPGCFSMYRIKASKGPDFPGFEVPLLANPDIVEEYSENNVATLHKKNLLLLGEDRYLTTLMLRTFPKRKTMFVPLAICKTVVPDRFSVLLSQRRRWINSTVHNLLELLLVKDLCGSFCFSMQFVIFMELIGTIVLPAAVCYGILLIVISILNPKNVPWGPLILQGAILGLPALLIVMTARRPIFLFWMLLYLISIPIWNFVLPIYAFWNFDDFTWGQTRRTDGDTLSRKKVLRRAENESDRIFREDSSFSDGEGEGGPPVAVHKDLRPSRPENKNLTTHRWSEWLKRRQRAVVLESQHPIPQPVQALPPPLQQIQQPLHSAQSILQQMPQSSPPATPSKEDHQHHHPSQAITMHHLPQGHQPLLHQNPLGYQSMLHGHTSYLQTNLPEHQIPLGHHIPQGHQTMSQFPHGQQPMLQPVSPEHQAMMQQAMLQPIPLSALSDPNLMSQIVAVPPGMAPPVREGMVAIPVGVVTQSAGREILEISRYTKRMRKKIVFLGDETCGKSSLITKFHDNSYNDVYSPTVIETYTPTTSKLGKLFELCDTSGSEELDRLRPFSYDDVDAWVLCFAVDEKFSLQSVEDKWLPECKYYAPELPILLIGCKSDKRVSTPDASFVTTEEVNEFIAENGISEYVECSALSGDNVELVFKRIMSLTFGEEFELSDIASEILTAASIASRKVNHTETVESISETDNLHDKESISTNSIIDPPVVESTDASSNLETVPEVEKVASESVAEETNASETNTDEKELVNFDSAPPEELSTKETEVAALDVETSQKTDIEGEDENLVEDSTKIEAEISEVEKAPFLPNERLSVDRIERKPVDPKPKDEEKLILPTLSQDLDSNHSQNRKRRANNRAKEGDSCNCVIL